MGEESQYKLGYSYHKIFFPFKTVYECHVEFPSYHTDLGEKSEYMIALRVSVSQQIKHDCVMFQWVISVRKRRHNRMPTVLCIKEQRFYVDEQFPE